MGAPGPDASWPAPVRMPYGCSWPAPMAGARMPYGWPAPGVLASARTRVVSDAVRFTVFEKWCVVQEVGADGLGAAHVHEVTAEDWESLPSWASLRPLQQRRLLRSRPAGSGAPAP